MPQKAALSSEKGLIPVPVLVAMVVVGILLVVAKINKDTPVLGISTRLLAQSGPPPEGGASQPPPPQPAAPPPESNPPALQQAQQPPPPQNTQATNPSGSGNGQQQYQPKNAEEQKQYEQYRQQTPEQQKQKFQQYQAQGADQRNQRYQPGNTPTTQQQGNDSQPNTQRPPQGNFQGNNGGFQQPGQNPGPSEQQRFQQLQSQWQQDAAKFGFQIQPGSFSPGQAGQNGKYPDFQTAAEFPKIAGDFKVAVQGQGGNQQINLNDGKTVVNLGSLQAVRPDGSKFEIDKEAVEKIHAAIKLETGADISQNDKGFVMKRGDVSVDTKLPIGFNVATKTFTVQTASGEKEVKVLPDEAIAKIKEAKANFTANATQVKLQEYNSEPVYAIPGNSHQKLLGFFPVAIPATSLMSANTGGVVGLQEDTISRLLDTISF